MTRRTLKRVIGLMCLCLLFFSVLNIHTARAEEDKKEIIIGTHLPLSGDLAMSAAEQRWGYEQAIIDINKRGGIYVKDYGRKLPVRLIVVDDKTDPGKAALAVERLIKQTGVDLLLSGMTGEHGVLPGLITAEKYRKYYHATTIWIPNFLEHNFKWGSMFFFDMTQGASMFYEIWKTLPKEQRSKKPALFLEDTFGGKMFGDLLAELAEKYGYKIALRESMGTGDKDFGKQIANAKSAGVDAILLFANPAETIALVRQMKKNDFNVRFFQGWKGAWPSEFLKALGEDAQYILIDGFWSMDYPFPGAKELGERYFDENGKYSVSVGMYYALCQILWQAIEKAGTLDSAKIRRAVLDNEFDTIMGKVDYDERGIALFRLAAFQWWNGKQEILYPFEYSKGNIKAAPPWDKR